MFEKREHNCREFVRLDQMEDDGIDKHVRSLLKRTSSGDGGCMLVSELGGGSSCANLQTQGETPATRGGRVQGSCYESPLRTKNRASLSSINLDNNTEARSSVVVTGSRGRLPLPNGQRYSYALGAGNYLLLEEVEPHQAMDYHASELVQARDLSKEFMQVDHSSSPFKLSNRHQQS